MTPSAFLEWCHIGVNFGNTLWTGEWDFHPQFISDYPLYPITLLEKTFRTEPSQS